jgi:hypothetical protein
MQSKANIVAVFGSGLQCMQRSQLICPPGCFANSLSSLICKNNSLRGLVETALVIPAVPPWSRGAYRDRHGRWARDAMDAAARARRTALIRLR